MLKQLRVKFVIINMTLVTLMLLVIFGMIVHQTQENLKQQSIQMLQAIGEDPFRMDRPGSRPGDKQPNHPGTQPDNEPPAHADSVRLPYFAVQIDFQGQIQRISGGFFDLTDEALILEVTQAALRSSDSGGDLQQYSMRFCKFNAHNGETLVFVDITSEKATIADLIRTCMAAAFSCISLVMWV